MYNAKILEVLIASPSDTREHREIIRQSVIHWNTTESRYLGVTLLPVMWETHTYPDLSLSPQRIINQQIVDDADILIAIFWTTLGTPTEDAKSGTIEEIERFVSRSKPVLLYFCNMPYTLPDNDEAALVTLRAYLEEMKKKGLLSSYTSLEELSVKIRDHLTKLIHEKFAIEEVSSSALNGGRDSDVSAQRRDIDAALSGLRNELRGYVVKWQTVFRSLENDFSVDKRLTLASEIEDVTLEFVRVASIDAPGAWFVTRLSEIANEAHVVASTRVYLDGGISFRKLTDGCEGVISDILTTVEAEWVLPGSDAT